MNQIPPTQPAAPKSAGPVVGIIIIIVVLVIGALYFWGDQLNKQTPQTQEIPIGALDQATTSLQ